MNQPSLDFSRPSLTPQSQRLLERLKLGEITNVQMRDELRLLSYTRRLFEVKKAVGRVRLEGYHERPHTSTRQSGEAQPVFAELNNKSTFGMIRPVLAGHLKEGL
jgi:hypothetical protein